MRIALQTLRHETREAREAAPHRSRSPQHRTKSTTTITAWAGPLPNEGGLIVPRGDWAQFA